MAVLLFSTDKQNTDNVFFMLTVVTVYLITKPNTCKNKLVSMTRMSCNKVFVLISSTVTIALFLL